jgi:hypothetical protein
MIGVIVLAHSPEPMSASPGPALNSAPSHLARWTLTAFLLTFLVTRTLVLRIMTRRLPDLFLYAGQTHVHHLNYGIFLLAAVGAWLLFAPPQRDSGLAGRASAAALYGIGLALTFDEFGMWLHLGGSYWQRASYDAIVTVAALLALVASAPALRRFGPWHWAWAGAIGVILTLIVALTAEHLRKLGPPLERIEQRGPR